jgi:two-component system, LytTR family, response regulator
MTVCALIVDDDAPARRRLRRLLSRVGGVDVVGECPDGVSALAGVRSLAPDLLFLDVQMPGLDGLAVLDAFDSRAAPDVVFVTAFDRYAVDAFDRHAIDYLLKPVEEERVRRAVERFRQRREADDAAALHRRLSGLMEALGAKTVDRLLVKERDRAYFIAVRDVDWVEAARNYVRLHVGPRTHVLRSTLAALEARLDSRRFRRINRSTLVNLDRVREWQPWFHGDGVIVLTTRARLRLSRRYREQFLADS